MSEHAEINALWDELQKLSDKEKIKKDAKSLMQAKDSALRQKENDIELLIMRLNLDEREVKDSSKSLRLLQDSKAGGNDY